MMGRSVIETTFLAQRTLKGDVMKQPLRLAIAGIAWMLTSPISIAPAAGTFSGTVTGLFDAPVLSGAYLDVGGRRPVAQDNTSTAASSGMSTSIVTWGSGGNAGTLPPSSLEFAGDSFDEVASGDIFRLGTLTYFNGPSTPPSLIFGLTLHLSAGDGIAPFAGPVALISTQNGNVDRLADADLLALSSIEVPSNLAAFEGAAVKAIVYGKIIDDARLEVTSISLAPGEVANGCVEEGTDVKSRPCASACGDVCAAITVDLAHLCGGEVLPTVLNGRIGHALDLLGQGASTEHEMKARKAVRLALKELHRSAAIARRAGKSARISGACAEAIDKAAGNAQNHAELWLGIPGG